jgi:hypothetical protein
MAELADAADSKSADLRVLGVRLPLPAPAFKAASDAGLKHMATPKTELAGPYPKMPCDAVVTGAERNQQHSKGSEPPTAIRGHTGSQ